VWSLETSVLVAPGRMNAKADPCWTLIAKQKLTNRIKRYGLARQEISDKTDEPKRTDEI
jgi:adenylosuccinate lyase